MEKNMFTKNFLELMEETNFDKKIREINEQIIDFNKNKSELLEEDYQIIKYQIKKSINELKSELVITN